MKLVRRYVTPASAQVRVQHRKSSPVDRMNPGRVTKGLVAAWCNPGKLRVLLTHLPVGADTACVRYDICLISIQTRGVSLPV